MFIWHTIHYIRMIIPYILGVFTSFYLLNNQWQIAILFIPGIILSTYYYLQKQSERFSKDTIYGLALFCLLFALGSFRQFTYNELNTPNHFSKIPQSEFLITIVEEEPFDRENFVRVRLRVRGGIDSLQNYYKETGSILAYFRKPLSENFTIGKEVIIDASNIQEVAPPRNPGEFDYKRFLSYQNIYFQVFLDQDQWKSTGVHYQSITRIASQARAQIISQIGDLFPDPEHKGFTEALLVGYRNNLNTEIVDSFSKTGTLHVLAVSGLHVGIIFLILNFIGKVFSGSKHENVIRVLIVIIGIWVYAFITGMSPSVKRAAIMFSIVQLGLLLRRRPQIYNSIYASAFIILLFNPFLIVSVSFQLSYAAVLGIVFFQPKIRNWFIPQNKITQYIWDLIAVSLAAQIATFPLGIFYFYQFPLYFLLSNLVVIPAIFVAMLSLISAVSFSWIPVLGTAIIWVANQCIDFILWTVKTMQSLPYASFEYLYVTPFQLILIYLIIFGFTMWLYSAYKPYLFFTLVLVVISITSVTYRFSIINSQEFSILHSINKHKVISIVNGRNVHFISDSSFIQDKNSQRFYLRPYIAKYGLRNITFNSWNDTISQNHFILKNHSLQIKDHTIIFRDKWLLLHNNINGANTALVFNYWDLRRLEYLKKKSIVLLELKQWMKFE
ncbi:MAG: ComEC/Rec2 family competence protein [Bacteroidetes bacterium]|nr:ComEC/Rec2 family competence protein [Bacteroidota bacterium]